MEKEELDRIKGKHSTAVKSKREMFKVWLKKALNPTWSNLVEALRRVDLPAAEEVAREYGLPVPAPPSPAPDTGEEEDRPDSGVESPDEDGLVSPEKEVCHFPVSHVTCGMLLGVTTVACQNLAT